MFYTHFGIYTTNTTRSIEGGALGHIPTTGAARRVALVPLLFLLNIPN